MIEPQITATVLNPGDHHGPWDVELVLTSPDGERVATQTITHGGSGCDWDEKAGPVLDGFRRLVAERGWTAKAA